MIREARPCHLYFDLEFVPAVNAGVQGDALVDALLRLVDAELRCEDPWPLPGTQHEMRCRPCSCGEFIASGCCDCLACAYYSFSAPELLLFDFQTKVV